MLSIYPGEIDGIKNMSRFTNFIESQRIAMRNDERAYLLFSDHLGSSSVVMNANGEVVEKAFYLPWGGTRGEEAITSTDYGYTGQMKEGDIYYYGARYYDPAIGRFMQADTIVALNVQGTQAFDRYAYVNNNPLRYTDPSGHSISPTNKMMLDGGGSGPTIPKRFDITGFLKYAGERRIDDYSKNEFFSDKLGSPCVMFVMDSVTNAFGGGLELIDPRTKMKIDPANRDEWGEQKRYQLVHTVPVDELLRYQKGVEVFEYTYDKSLDLSPAWQFKRGDVVIINQVNDANIPWGHMVMVESVNLAAGKVIILEMGNPSISNGEFNRRNFFDVNNELLGYRIYRIPEY